MNRAVLIAHVTISKPSVDGKRSTIVDTGQNGLVLEKCLVYTLQGPNGSGKSSLIRALMGVTDSYIDNPVQIRVDNEVIKVADVADAIKYGLVAVFQDDELIPTMTIREQLLLRHARNGFKTIVLELTKNLIERIPFIQARDVLSFMSLPKTDEEIVVQKVTELLLKYDEYSSQSRYIEIMNKFPKELSGGEHAVARIILSQVTQGIKVLFLDEVFRGVQQEVWPHIVDATRDWARDNNITILAVSHSSEELGRWRPHGRFAMSNRQLRRIPPTNYHSLLPGLPSKNSLCPVIDIAEEHEWCNELNIKGPWIIVCDSALQNSSTYLSVRNQLNGSIFLEEFVDASEDIKSLKTSIDFLDKLASHESLSRTSRGASMLIIGGGTLINSASFVASILHRGVPTIILPTTIMALADVALGSKTSINYKSLATSMFQKHMIGTYHNPFAILLDKSVFATLSPIQLRIGLAECLKHGLLQDCELWSDAIRLFREAQPNWSNCYDIAVQTLELKARILSIDPWEVSYGRILLYGHLHAHAIESISQFQIPHGIAVVFGMLVDLRLSGIDKSPYSDLLQACADSSFFKHGLMEDILTKAEKDWESTYAYETKPQHISSRMIHYLVFKGVGCYQDSSCFNSSNDIGNIKWGDFWKVFMKVKGDILQVIT